MIDIEKTISLMGYDPLMLSYGSGRKVWAICNSCGDGRRVKFQGYHDLCNDCSKNTPEYKKRQSETSTEQFSTQESRDMASIKKIRFHINNPEWGIASSLRQIQYHLDNPDAGKEHGKRLRNSDAHKAASEAKRAVMTL